MSPFSCYQCAKIAPVDERTFGNPTYVDAVTLLRVDHGWLELRWGKAMRAIFCSANCVRTFVP